MFERQTASGADFDVTVFWGCDEQTGVYKCSLHCGNCDIFDTGEVISCSLFGGAPWQGGVRVFGNDAAFRCFEAFEQSNELLYHGDWYDKRCCWSPKRGAGVSAVPIARAAWRIGAADSRATPKTRVKTVEILSKRTDRKSGSEV